MTTPIDTPDHTTIVTHDWLPGYEMLSAVGSGGFATVYKARQLKLDRMVAVKVIRHDLMADRGQAARFETEAVVLGKFRHPNIVHVYDLGSHDGRLFIAEELLEGEDLGDRLKRDGPLDERVAWHIARQAAAGLAHAAAHGVVHRDVKPANLYLTQPPTGIGWPAGVPLVKVMDFGIARVKWAIDSDGFPRTSQGTVVGTPAYMAPEQHQSVEDLDHRADVYALGATTYHALTGRAPFTGKSVWDLMARKLTDTPEMFDGLPTGSADLLRVMLAPDRADRIGTYDDLTGRIDKLLSRLNDPRSRTRRVSSRRWRFDVRWVAVPALIAAAVTAGVGLRYKFRPAVPASPGPAYVSTGEQQFLFTGSPSVLDWLAPEAGGNWTVEKDEEGVSVLAGTGFTRRAYRHPTDYRITIGLDLHQATAAELQFGLPAKAAEVSPRYVLRVSKTDGAVLGTRVGSRGPLTPLAGPQAFPPAAWFQDRRPYLEVRIDRTPDGWVAWFNGTFLGRAAASAEPPADEFRLAAEGGKARIDSAILEPIRPK
jgi:eukaryotic-like serine/threonine-protein kinase